MRGVAALTAHAQTATAPTVRKAALFTALIFALCHLAQPWKLPIAFAFSLAMIALYRRTAALTWPMCAHAVFDLLWFGLVGLP